VLWQWRHCTSCIKRYYRGILSPGVRKLQFRARCSESRSKKALDVELWRRRRRRRADTTAGNCVARAGGHLLGTGRLTMVGVNRETGRPAPPHGLKVIAPGRFDRPRLQRPINQSTSVAIHPPRATERWASAAGAGVRHQRALFFAPVGRNSLPLPYWLSSFRRICQQTNIITLARGLACFYDVWIMWINSWLYCSMTATPLCHY